MLSVRICLAQFAGPIPQPTSGYGSWGSNTVDSIEFYNPADPTDTSLIYFPQGAASAVPTVFYMHGAGGNTPAFNREFFHFIASKGFACVYVPYQSLASTLMAYSVMYNGFVHAARNYPNIIDTTRVGFSGHSIGGGACFCIAYNLCGTLNWGSNGRFLMPIAQWYTFAITETELQSFPSNTYLLSIIYDKDSVCDQRMTLDAFHHVSIPNADKDVVLVTPSLYQTYNYTASHTAFNTTTYDALDVYVTFRLLDAMMDFVFNQNLAAKNVCLGDGSASQTTMPAGLNSLIVSDTLTAWHPESSYGYPCSDVNNPRWNYCDVALHNGQTLSPASIQIVQISHGILLMNAPVGSVYEISNAFGQVVQNGTVRTDAERISTEFLSSGIYFIQCRERSIRFVIQ